MTTEIGDTMKAFVYDPEGAEKMSWSPKFPVPDISANEVLIKTTAASLNPFDFKVTESTAMFAGYRGTPVGCDMAGTIVKLGKNVEGFQIGDKVFGWGAGLAEYSVSDPTRISRVPHDKNEADFSFLPCVAVTAYQLLNKYWWSKPGFQVSSIAVMGAAGGVGTCLVQMARQFGGPELKIYAFSSQKNEDYLKSIGASHFIDDSQAGFDISRTIIPEKSLDLMVDLVSGPPEGPNYIETGMGLIKPNTGKWITLNTLSSTDDLAENIRKLTGITLRDNYDLFMVHRAGSSQDLSKIASMIAENKLTVPIAEELQFNETAIRSGFSKLKQRHHARGKFKVVVGK
jgi:NADPH:quinone reductase-like Zn-dependent oxidoreductase